MKYFVLAWTIFMGIWIVLHPVEYAVISFTIWAFVAGLMGAYMHVQVWLRSWDYDPKE